MAVNSSTSAPVNGSDPLVDEDDCAAVCTFVPPDPDVPPDPEDPDPPDPPPLDLVMGGNPPPPCPVPVPPPPPPGPVAMVVGGVQPV
jgi:hypothetical protein